MVARRRGAERSLWGVALVAMLLGLCTPGAGAARTEEFRAASQAELLQGEFDGVALAADGALAPGPQSTRWFGDEVAYVWRLIPGRGGEVLAATGSQGTLYRLSGEGSWEVLAGTLEYELFALARGPRGELVVAGAPNGTITRLDADGDAETLVDLPEGLVWELAFGPDGELYAATGESGNVYRIQEHGAAEVFAQVPDAHVVALAWWDERLICGTDGRGLLLALDPEDGTTAVLFDAPEEEIVAVLPQEDRLLFAANGAGLSGGESSGDPFVLPVIEVRPDGGNSGGGTLYAIDREGFVRSVWRAPELHILSLATAPDGTLLVGTGSEGVLYGLDSLWNATRLLDLDEADILSLLRHEDEVFVGTGNGGSVYRLAWDGARSGTYTSRVYDAGQTARWGRPYWVRAGEGRIEFATRSGQTAEPDESWGPWAPLAEGRIVSPVARFLQWRISLESARGQALRVGPIGVPYRGPNRPPQITELDVTPKAPVITRANGLGAPVRQELASGVQVEYSLNSDSGGASRVEPGPGHWARTLRSASWRAEDPDDDALRFDLYLRFMDDDGFVPLKSDLESHAWTWEAAAWPDGWYQLKVVARDGAGNAPGEALEAVRLSAPFQIDNTPPQLLDLAISGGPGNYLLEGRAQDVGSRLRSLEFSLDGEAWQRGLPLDGILDDWVEEFAIPLPQTKDGRPPSVVGVRVADEVGHVATGRIRLPGR
ncbi:MAG: hypothetical protein KAY32_13405 [Candidatus Eisenbacteria sp.]|nr:hypothetical protein [Candidatus Eisenbacteria bacterium]